MPTLYEKTGMKIVLFDLEKEKEYLKNEIDFALRDKRISTIMEIRYGQPERIYIRDNGLKYSYPSYRTDDRPSSILQTIMLSEYKHGEKLDDFRYCIPITLSEIRKTIIGRLYRPMAGNDTGDSAIFIMIGVCTGIIYVFSTTQMLNVMNSKMGDWFDSDMRYVKNIYDELKSIKQKVYSPEVSETGMIKWCNLIENYY